MNKKNAICEYLKKNHTGRDNAVHSKELERLFFDGRKKSQAKDQCSSSGRLSHLQ